MLLRKVEWAQGLRELVHASAAPGGAVSAAAICAARKVADRKAEVASHSSQRAKELLSNLLGERRHQAGAAADLGTQRLNFRTEVAP